MRAFDFDLDLNDGFFFRDFPGKHSKQSNLHIFGLMGNNSFEFFVFLKKNGLAGRIHNNLLDGHVLVMSAGYSQGKLVDCSLVRDDADVEIVYGDGIDAHHLE